MLRPRPIARANPPGNSLRARPTKQTPPARRGPSFVQERLPTVRIVEAVYSDVPFEVLVGTGPERRDGVQANHDHGADHDHRFVSWVYQRSGPFDLAALLQTIASLPRSVYRIKGFVYGDRDRERRHLLQAVGMRADIVPHDPWGSAEPDTCLVVIADSETTDHDDVIGRFDACRVASDDATVT